MATWAFGVALQEMAAIVSERGFHVVAGAAFIGEHSFSHDKLPLAAGRPDPQDLQTAQSFGAQVVSKLIHSPGNFIQWQPGHARQAAPDVTNPAAKQLGALCPLACAGSARLHTVRCLHEGLSDGCHRCGQPADRRIKVRALLCLRASLPVRRAQDRAAKQMDFLSFPESEREASPVIPY